jgi:hypothetical protein
MNSSIKTLRVTTRGTMTLSIIRIVTQHYGIFAGKVYGRHNMIIVQATGQSFDKLLNQGTLAVGEGLIQLTSLLR